MPEQIGYLKAMGLEYGYGPTAVMEWAFEHVHIYSGGPWWLSIVLTMAAVRVAMFYPSKIAATESAKLAHIKPQLDPINQKMRDSSANGDRIGVVQARDQMSQMYLQAGISRRKLLLPMISPILGFGSFWILRAMAHLPVPALATGGVLWFPNLTIPDPYFLLPFATALTSHLLFKVKSQLGSILQC